jgi:hypothetical protein
MDELFAVDAEARRKALTTAARHVLRQETADFWNIRELELSNNLAENSMRPVALGRKNWIHIGNPLAGLRVAAILSVVESCRRLTPAAWVARHA